MKPTKLVMQAFGTYAEQTEIDFTQCVGCNVCSQLCKFDAIEEGK